MAHRKKTLRRMPENTRTLARLIGELESTSRKLKNHLDKVWDMEIDSHTLARMNSILEAATKEPASKPTKQPDELFPETGEKTP